MTDRMVVTAVRITVLIGSGAATAGSTALVATGHAYFWVEEFLVAIALVSVCFGAFAWVIIPRQPRNAAVWAMAATSLSGTYIAGTGWVAAVLDVDPAATIAVPPSALPSAVGWTMMVATPGFVGLMVLVTFGLLLFPDGRLPSPRWRPVAWVAGGALSLWAPMHAWSFLPTRTSLAEEGGHLDAVLMVHLVTIVLSGVALVRRWRRSHGEARQQFKWVAWGGSMFAAVLIAVIVSSAEPALLVPFLVSTIAFLVSYGVAIGKYRLYDIDLVISRTLVYGTLAVAITGGYVVTVVGVGRLLGGGSEPRAAVAVAATAGVAVAFQPLRRRLQRVADRLVYGRKVTPHEVLSSFSRRLAAPDDRLFRQVTRSLVEGTGAHRAAVRVRIDGRFVEAARWPSTDGAVGGEVVVCPIEHSGAELGQLTLLTPTGQHLSEGDLRLARDVAAGLGLALRNRLLTGTLRTRVAELRESRRRLVAARDETRRRLERDLHDGAQQQLVALKVKLGLAQALAEREGGAGVATLLRQLADRADHAVEAVRDFARGVYPPMLEAEGLGAAITAQARRLSVPVTVELGRLRRYARQIEATVYFCVVELLQNLAEPGGRSEFRVRVSEGDGVVHVEVTEVGGRDKPQAGADRPELVDVTDRMEAADGTVSVRTEPDGGTSVRGSIPIEAGP